MIERDAFGANLRRQRVRSGVSLEEIARATRVSIDLWEGLERNDFSRWPVGIYARAYVRAYALAVGLDPEETVDDFCRGFPQADRRAEPIVRGTAEIVGHALAWRDEVPATIARDRRTNTDPLPVPRLGIGQARALAAGLDLFVVGVVSIGAAALTHVNAWATIAVLTVSDFGMSVGLLGTTVGVWLVDAYASAHPEFSATAAVFRRFQRSARFARGVRLPPSLQLRRTAEALAEAGQPDQSRR